ncbi:unnamed protein product [Calypogeia fissa]
MQSPGDLSHAESSLAQCRPPFAKPTRTDWARVQAAPHALGRFAGTHQLHFNIVSTLFKVWYSRPVSAGPQFGPAFELIHSLEEPSTGPPRGQDGRRYKPLDEFRSVVQRRSQETRPEHDGQERTEWPGGRYNRDGGPYESLQWDRMESFFTVGSRIDGCKQGVKWKRWGEGGVP